MNEEKKRILDMLSEGKISSDDAAGLLDALDISKPDETGELSKGGNKKPRFMFVKVASANNDNVDVKVPLNLLRSGLKLTSLIPPHAMDQIHSSMNEHGVNFDLSNIKQDDIEELIENLAEMEVNVYSKDGDNVKVFCA